MIVVYAVRYYANFQGYAAMYGSETPAVVGQTTYGAHAAIGNYVQHQQPQTQYTPWNANYGALATQMTDSYGMQARQPQLNAQNCEFGVWDVWLSW